MVTLLETHFRKEHPWFELKKELIRSRGMNTIIDKILKFYLFDRNISAFNKNYGIEIENLLNEVFNEKFPKIDMQRKFSVTINKENINIEIYPKFLECIEEEYPEFLV